MNMLTVPMVVEAGDRVERAYDIYSLLLKNRVIMLGTAVNPQSANLIVAQLLFLDREDSERRIQMYINSPGGEVYAGMAIYDAMQEITAPVSTVAVGQTASFGTVVLAAGEAGMRHSLPHSTIHMHQPLGGTQGQVSDMQITVDHFQFLKEELIHFQLLFWYAILFVIVPFAWFLFQLKSAKSQLNFSKLSRLLKIIMCFGILSMLFIQL